MFSLKLKATFPFDFNHSLFGLISVVQKLFAQSLNLHY